MIQVKVGEYWFTSRAVDMMIDNKIDQLIRVQASFERWDWCGKGLTCYWKTDKNDN